MQIKGHKNVGEAQKRAFVRALTDGVAGGNGGGELGDCAGEHAVQEVARVSLVLGDALALEVFG